MERVIQNSNELIFHSIFLDGIHTHNNNKILKRKVMNSQPKSWLTLKSIEFVLSCSSFDEKDSYKLYALTLSLWASILIRKRKMILQLGSFTFFLIIWTHKTLFIFGNDPLMWKTHTVPQYQSFQLNHTHL